MQYQTQYIGDLGVFFIDTGLALQPVGGSPGPGEYNSNGGNYQFNVADAGKAVAISYSWQQSNSNVDPSSTLQFTLIEGTPAQAPWTFLSSNAPSQAFGYSTLALVGTPKMDLGEAAQLPNYNYEVYASFIFGGGIVDADVASCIEDLLFNPYYGSQFQGDVDESLETIARDYWNSNNYFISPVLNSSQSCSDIIQQWCDAGNTGVYWSEGLLKFIPYGDTTTVANGYVYTPQTAPVVDLNDDDFIAEDNEDPVTIERSPWQDAYNQVKIQFTNRINNYNQDVVTEQDDYATAQYGLRPEGQQDFSFLCTQDAATFAANIRLKRLVYIRKKYTFKISGLRYCFLEPMDLVTLTDIMLGLEKEPVRITSIEEDEDRTYTVTAEEFPWGTATATLYPKQPGQPGPPPPSLVDPGNTNVVSIFEPTARVATTLANSQFQLWMALNGGANWGGCNVWLSFDNASYQQIGVQQGPSRAGVMTAPLPQHADPDLDDTLSVSTSGQLFDVTQAQADAFSTLCLIGNEYISYQNATLTGSTNNFSTNDYNLTYLRRGVFSSPNVAHTTGETFVRCDSQIFTYSFDPSLAGKTIYFKFTSFNLLQNQVQSLDEVQAYPITIGGGNIATNMTIDSVLDSGGETATIRIYQAGQPVGTAGSAHLDNGAIVVLPADSESGKNIDTLYYVNFNATTSEYVFYTDQNAWLTDEIINGYLRIGQVTTAGNYAVIPIQGGGSIAIGAGQGNFGSEINVPTGFSLANIAAFVTPRSGFNSGQEINGVNTSTQSGGVLNSSFNWRSGGTTPASSNWVAIAWQSGSGVTVATVGAFTQISFTTANGDEMCFTVGSMNGGSVPVPSGFSASNWVGIVGMASTNSTGNGLQGIRQCSLNGFLTGTALYDDNDGNLWGGTQNVLGCFWKPGGNVSQVSVAGGIAIVLPTSPGHQLALIQAFLSDGASFGVPSGFESGSLVSATSMAAFTPDGDNISHGWPNCQTSGSTGSYSYEDGEGHIWAGGGNVFAITSL